MNQLIPFDQSKGGTRPLFCLDNVRRGYGISNKYGSAWIAWQHTQQHFDPPPPNLDVPLFYSYTVKIDGVTANYGHINVRLKDGRVWSDGYTYQSIEAYTSTHAPKYVGWGESINDFKILEGEEMPTPEQVDLEFQSVFNRQATADEVSYWIKRDWTEFLQWCLKNSVDQRTKASEFDNVNAALLRSDAEVDKLRKELAAEATPLEPGKYSFGV